MTKVAQTAAILAAMTVLGWSAWVQAQGGLVQKASKEATKGALKGAQQELNSGQFVNNAKQVTKGIIDGIADSAPLMTSQILNQANVNKKTIGKVARQISSDAVSGALSTSVKEVNQALGEKGDGPLADTLSATAERVTQAAMRGVVAEIHLDPATTERLAASVVRGAVSEIHFNFRPWPLVLAFVLGSVSTLLCGIGLMLLYLLFQRRRPPEPRAVAVVRGQPVPSIS